MNMSALDNKRVRAHADESVSKHIVDMLIEERSRGLHSNKLVWPIVRAFFFPLLRYREAIRMADHIRDLTAAEIFDHMSELLTLDLRVSGQDSIPETGTAIFVANHPTGIADGFVVHDILSPIRKDAVYLANRDAIRVAAGLDQMVIPVEWVDEKRSRERSRETFRALVSAFRDQRAIVIFPSGRLARMENKKLVERPWTITAVNLARKYDAPIIPMYIDGRNSGLFYFLWHLSLELKDMTLFHEVLNKKGQRYDVTIGAPILPSDLKGDAQQVTDRLRSYLLHDLVSGLPFAP